MSRKALEAPGFKSRFSRDTAFLKCPKYSKAEGICLSDVTCPSPEKLKKNWIEWHSAHKLYQTLKGTTPIKNNRSSKGMESMVGWNIKMSVGASHIAEGLEHVAQSWIFKVFLLEFLKMNHTGKNSFRKWEAERKNQCLSLRWVWSVLFSHHVSNSWRNEMSAIMLNTFNWPSLYPTEKSMIFRVWSTQGNFTNTASADWRYPDMNSLMCALNWSFWG